jgi:hypothetical protein
MTNLAAGKQNADRDGEIKRAATLAKIGWCEIDRDATSGPGVSSRTNGGAYALARLPYGGIGESHNSCRRDTRGNVNLDLNGNPLNANERGRGD